MLSDPVSPPLCIVRSDGIQLSILTEKLDEDLNHLGVSRRSRFGDAMPRLLERLAERSERSFDSRLHESLGCKPSVKIVTESIDPIDHRLSERSVCTNHRIKLLEFDSELFRCFLGHDSKPNHAPPSVSVMPTQLPALAPRFFDQTSHRFTSTK
jgi:hypothetical protein